MSDPLPSPPPSGRRCRRSVCSAATPSPARPAPLWPGPRPTPPNGPPQAAPWSKTGGLGDVVGSLPIALAARGHRVMVVIPRYADYEDTVDTGVSRAPARRGAARRGAARGPSRAAKRGEARCGVWVAGGGGMRAYRGGGWAAA